MSSLEKIDLNSLITDTDPVAESVAAVSTWYKTENAELENPTEETVAWHVAQGWTVTDNYTTGGFLTTFPERNIYKLERKVLNSQNALQHLVRSFTSAYNEGRTLNDQRYDDIVAIYADMVDKTEDSYIALDADDTAFDDLIENLIDGLESDQAAYAADVDGDLDDWGDSLLQDINTRFDNLVSSEKQKLIDRGMYNATILSTTTAGIEYQRSKALTDAEDQIKQRQLQLKDRIYQTEVNMRNNVLSARDRLRDRLQNSTDKRVSMRNDIIRALTNFMERREDGYPDLGSLGNLAVELGAGSPSGFISSDR